MHVGLGKIVVWKRKTKETPILILSFPVLFYLTVICKKKTKFLEQIMDLLWDTFFVCSFFATYSK